jgi:uncharacterized membrane protein
MSFDYVKVCFQYSTLIILVIIFILFIVRKRQTAKVSNNQLVKNDKFVVYAKNKDILKKIGYGIFMWLLLLTIWILIQQLVGKLCSSSFRR